MTSAAPHPVQTGYFDPSDAPSYDQLVHCMRCGLCLPTCPTYSLYHLEKASPRGRLALMRAVSEGRLGVTPGFGEAMTLCLGCLACQTACPAGVPFGELLEMARHQAEARQKRKRFICAERLRNWLLSRVVYGPRGLERLMPLLRFYQNAGLQRRHLGTDGTPATAQVSPSGARGCRARGATLPGSRGTAHRLS